MALRNIVEVGDEVLNKTSRPVEKIDQKILTLLDDMAETMYHRDGVGLAAPQVGVLRRMVVIDVGEGLIELINPVIVSAEGEQDGQEGCLSVPGKYGYVVRPNKVTVRALNRHGEEITVTGEELLARAFCHEIDHLNGRLFTELVSRYIEDDE